MSTHSFEDKLPSSIQKFFQDVDATRGTPTTGHETEHVASNPLAKCSSYDSLGIEEARQHQIVPIDAGRERGPVLFELRDPYSFLTPCLAAVYLVAAIYAMWWGVLQLANQKLARGGEKLPSVSSEVRVLVDSIPVEVRERIIEQWDNGKFQEAVSSLVVAIDTKYKDTSDRTSVSRLKNATLGHLSVVVEALRATSRRSEGGLGDGGATADDQGIAAPTTSPKNKIFNRQ